MTINKNFIAPALPVPPLEYDQRYSTELIRVLRLYFNQLDNYLNTVTTEVNDMQEPYDLQVAKGLVPGTTGLFKFGFNADIDQTEETVWDAGGLYTYPASALAMTIVSSNANDTSAGTGARTVRVIGLDANYAEVTQTVSLNGTTTVSIPTSLIRVYRAFVVTAGSGNTAAGTITIANGGTTYAQITVGENQTLMAVYTVPAGVTLYLTSADVSTGSASGTQYIVSRLIQRPFGGVFRDVSKVSLQSGQVSFDGFAAPLVFPAKTDIEIRAVGSANNNEVSGVFSGYLVQDGY